ncbi:MAG: hypothetical protein IJN08_01540 [Clostridia bacterium]|nr:hypothetical protein [Clostridia bacterium]
MKKLLYMHYPKSRTTGAAFCLGECGSFIMAVKGSGGFLFARPDTTIVFARREKIPKEGRRQPVRWNHPPAPTSAVYQKEKEKTRKE